MTINIAIKHGKQTWLFFHLLSIVLLVYQNVSRYTAIPAMMDRPFVWPWPETNGWDWRRRHGPHGPRLKNNRNSSWNSCSLRFDANISHQIIQSSALWRWTIESHSGLPWPLLGGVVERRTFRSCDLSGHAESAKCLHPFGKFWKRIETDHQNQAISGWVSTVFCAACKHSTHVANGWTLLNGWISPQPCRHCFKFVQLRLIQNLHLIIKPELCSWRKKTYCTYIYIYI